MESPIKTDKSQMNVEKSHDKAESTPKSKEGRMSEEKVDSAAESIREGLGELLNINFIWKPRKL